MATSNKTQDSRAAQSRRVPLLLRPIGALMVLAAIVSLTLFGIVGVGRQGSQHETSDVIFPYAAGCSWWDGRDPYLSDTYQTYTGVSGVSFAYPPSVAPLCLALARLPLSSARILMMAANVSCLLAITMILVLSVRRQLAEAPPPDKVMPAAIVAAVAIGNPFTAHVVWMGQTSLLALAAVVGSWTAYRSRRKLLAGVLIGVASFKPQIAMLIYAWYLLDRQWRVLGFAAATAAALAAAPLWWHGLDSLPHWLSAMAAYQDAVHSRVGFQHVFGIRSLLSNLGLPAPSLIPIALGGAVLLYWRRSRFLAEDILPLLMCLSCLFVYAHDYDLVALLTMVGPLLVHLRRTPLALAVLLLITLVLFFPQRYVRNLPWSSATRYRECAVLVLMLWLFRLSIKAAVRRLGEGVNHGGDGRNTSC